MKYGTKFRTPFSTNVNDILKQFTCDIDFYIYKTASSYNKSITYFNW